MSRVRFDSFREFRSFHPPQHRNQMNRGLHVLNDIHLAALVMAAIARHFRWLLMALPIAGRGFARIGRLLFARRRLAAFRYPPCSFAGDRVAFACSVTGCGVKA